MRFLFFIVLIYTTSMFSQEDVLAKEYFKNGDFEKALLSYKALYNKTPNNNNYFVALIKSHQQLQQLDESEELLINQLSRITFPALYVELGYNYQLKNNLEQANINYDKAISFIDDNPNYAYSVGKYFENRSLLERAVTTYEKAMLLKPELNFNSQLARIYGEQGNVEKMFESYLNFIEFNDTYVSRIKHAFNEFISEDSENENNLILKKILLKKTQQKPNLLWNEFLSWLFIQQKDYKKAFIQEKAIFNRKPESLDRIDELAHIALNDDAFDIAGDIFKYISETAQVSEIQIDAHDNLLQIAIKTNQDLNSINNQYQNLFDAYGKSLTTLNLQISYAHFLAFHKHEPEEASLILKKSLALPLTNLQEGKVKLELADILVFEEKFNEALSKTKFVVGQNVEFDLNIMGCEYVRKNIETPLLKLPVLDTCTELTAALCKLPGGKGNRFKLPTLTELHEYLFHKPFKEAHNATADVEATARCFFELIRRQEFTIEQLDVSSDYFKNFSEQNPNEIKLIGLKHINLKKASEKIYGRLKREQEKLDAKKEEVDSSHLVEHTFSHLHNHTQFSILQSTMSVRELVHNAGKHNMPSVAITDHANIEL